MEQSCFNQHGVGILYCLTRQSFSAKIKIKIPHLQNIRQSLLKRENCKQSLFTVWFSMVHKKEEGTYHHIENLMKNMPGFLSPGKGVPLLLNPEYSGIKGQRIPDRSKTAHRQPPVKCFLTVGKVMSLLFTMLSRLVITFLPRSKRLFISRLQSPS